MPEYNFPIPGSKDEEDIIIYVHRHWACFLGQFFLSFFLLIIPISILILIYIFNHSFFRGLVTNIIVLILSVYYLIAIAFAFVSWVSFYYNVYIVTKDEIIEITQVGFFGRKISQLSLLRVQDITSHIKGFLPTLFDYGDVLVETAGEQSENFLLKDVPNPQEISTQIMNIHNTMIGHEGRENQMLEAEGVLKNEISPPEKISPAPETPPEKTSYQELLERDQPEACQHMAEKAEPQESREQEEELKQGEISKDDLDKGGEIELK